MRAFLMGLDDEVVADMVVFDRDILTAPTEEIKDIGVVTTIVDGKIVYQKGKGFLPLQLQDSGIDAKLTTQTTYFK